MTNPNDKLTSDWRKISTVQFRQTPEQLETLQELAKRWMQFVDDSLEAIFEFELLCAFDGHDRQAARQAKKSLRDATLLLALWLPIPQPILDSKFR